MSLLEEGGVAWLLRSDDDDAGMYIDEALFVEVYGGEGFLACHSAACDGLVQFFIN